MARQDLNETKEMTFLDHLEVLRWHLMRSVIAIVIIAIFAFVYKDFIFDDVIFAPRKSDFWTNRFLCETGIWMKEVLAGIGMEVPDGFLCINQESIIIQNIDMAGQFSTHIRISLIAGLILSFPYIFWEFWRFIKPALYDKERRHSRGAIFYTSFLFAAGVSFGYYLIVPLTLQFLGTYKVSDLVGNQITLNSYISTVTSVVMAAGVIWELPVLVYFFAKIGLVSADFLRKYRRHSIIVILALSAVITPPDVFSQVLVCLPLVVLYEVGIKIAIRVERNKLKDSEVVS